MFCEVSPELAKERGLRNGGWATIRTMRAEIEARVLVTRRIRPLKLNGRIVHQIGLPYHWSSKGIVTGDAANDLIAFTGDPNVSIQESKAFTAQIEPGRRSRGRRRITSGPVRPEIDPRGWERDLPQARGKPEASHGFKGRGDQGGQRLTWPPPKASSTDTHAVYRLQGLRSRLQAMEPVAGRRILLHRHVL